MTTGPNTKMATGSWSVISKILPPLKSASMPSQPTEAKIQSRFNTFTS